MEFSKIVVKALGLTFITVASLCGKAEAANLVRNGSFDNIGSVFVDNTSLGSDDLQTPGSTNVPMWSSVSGLANDFWTAPANSYGLTASVGNGSGYFVDLTGEDNNKPYGGLQQAVTTTPGEKYRLRFDLGASTIYNGAGLGAAALTASADSVSQHFVLSPTGVNQWQAETLGFTATSASTLIKFVADSAYTSRYTGLDNVQVSVVAGVPDFAIWGMMIVGFAIIGAALRHERYHKAIGRKWQSSRALSANRSTIARVI